MELWLEVDANEEKLSKPLLDQLVPFRLRPNHPDSIYNRPRAAVVGAQAAVAPPWVDLTVPNSNLRVWIEGSQLDLEPFQDAAEIIWKAFPDFFTYPLPDTPGGSSWFNSETINSDSRIDIYFVDGARADPRLGLCEDCALGGNPAETKPADPRRGRTRSGYVLINKSLSPDMLFSTMAHELAHVSQLALDVDERTRMWLVESTAEWVAYKVTKASGKTPAWGYSLLDPARAADHDFPPLYAVLGDPLIDYARRYPAWLFFHSASLDAGDGIVKAIWRRAAAEPGAQGQRAVDAVMPFKDHFPRFAMRNWNHDLVPDTYRYQAKDTSFPTHLRPRLRVNPAIFGGPAIEELTEPVPRLAAKYYRFQFLDPVRRVTIQNPYVKLENAHVWGFRRVGSVWKEPEDWSDTWERVFCRDTMDENVTELVIVVSNSDLDEEIPPGHPKPRVIAEAEGCKLLEGFGKSTLRLKDDIQDVTYVSSQVPLKFKPRRVQGPDGNVEYDLLPTSVTWRVNGRRHDCRIEGEGIVNIPMRVDQPLDPTLPAYGYMNVVVQRNGDYHSIEVSAIDTRSLQTVTCPGDPPIVTKEPFKVQHLLHVLQQANTHETGGAVVYKGQQTFESRTHPEQHAHEPKQRAIGPSRFSGPRLHHTRDAAAVERGADGIGSKRCRERRQSGLHVRVGAEAVMTKRIPATAAVGAIALLMAGPLLAQGALAQLGLTETAARNFVLGEIKGPSDDRSAPIGVAGTRAFLKLPPAARGPAATALFAWAKSYVSSAGFTASYNTYRNGRLPTERQYALSVDAQAKKEIAEQLAGFEQMRLAADKMPPKDRDMLMEQVKQALANLTNPAYADKLRAQLAAERAQESGQGSEIAVEVEATTPADPRKLFARRLREFLNATADVNFSARNDQPYRRPGWHRVPRQGGPRPPVDVASGRDRGPRSDRRGTRRGRHLVEGDRAMNRRQALSLLAALPLATRVSAQTRSTAKHRVALGGLGLLIEPGGTLKSWSAGSQTGPNPAADALGLGHNQPVDPFTLYPIPNLTGVVTAVVGSAACHAVVANGQVFSWGVGPYGTLGTTPLDELVTRVEPHFRSNTPVPVAAKLDAVDVSSMGEHVLALARDGSVYAWGRGDAGQLGIGALPMVNYKGPVAARREVCVVPRAHSWPHRCRRDQCRQRALAGAAEGRYRARVGRKQIGRGRRRDNHQSRYADSRTGCAKRRCHRRARLLLSGRLVRRYGHGLGQYPREQRSSTCTGGGRRRARPSLGRWWRRSCRGAHSNWRGHDLGHVRSLRDRPRQGRERTGARQGAHRRRVYRCLAVGQRSRPGVGTNHDVVRGAAVAQAGLQRTEQSQSLPDSDVARRTRAALALQFPTPKSQRPTTSNTQLPTET